MPVDRSLPEQILRACEFPQLPQAALQILRLTESRSGGLEELSDAIADDLALSRAVVRAINSGCFGLERKVTTVRQAVAMLGLQSVQTLVLGVSICRALSGGLLDSNATSAYWKRCVYGAAAARTLAARLLPARVEECFMGALLMDLGTLALHRAFGARYARLSQGNGAHARLIEAETAALGVQHADLAVALLRQWGLPAGLEVPVGAHHAPQKVEHPRRRAVAAILELSGLCAEVFITDHPAEAIAAARERMMRLHGMELAETDKMLARVQLKAQELAPLLQVAIKTQDFDSVLENATPRLLEIALTRQRERGSNQRRSRRHTREGTLLLCPCISGTLGQPVRVKLIDLSANGIGVVFARAMARGAQFVITLPQPGGAAKSLLYAAVRCEQVEGEFHIGAELRAVLNASPAPVENENGSSLIACGAD